MPRRRQKRRFPRTRDFFTKLGGLAASKGIAAWMHTLDTRAAFYDRVGRSGTRHRRPADLRLLARVHPVAAASARPLPSGDALSQHRDADILARVADHLGFDCVRGSTYRGGAKAIWEMFERQPQQHLTITPDGPRGPRRQLAQGPVYLASRLQMPLVVMGFGYDRPWRINSWDRFAVPRPFSRARAVVGPPIHVPADLDRDRPRNLPPTGRAAAELPDERGGGLGRGGHAQGGRDAGPAPVRPPARAARFDARIVARRFSLGPPSSATGKANRRAIAWLLFCMSVLTTTAQRTQRKSAT